MALMSFDFTSLVCCLRILFAKIYFISISDVFKDSLNNKNSYKLCRILNYLWNDPLAHKNVVWFKKIFKVEICFFILGRPFELKMPIIQFL